MKYNFLINEEQKTSQAEDVMKRLLASLTQQSIPLGGQFLLSTMKMHMERFD